MFRTPYHFNDILKWFKQSRFDYLMLFLPSIDTNDRKLEDYIIKNQYSIDRLTGNKIAYIVYDNVTIDDKFVRVTDRPMNLDSIRTHIRISEEVCNSLNIAQYKLPALILLSKDLKYKLYPIKTEADLDSYFTPISIVTSFLSDNHHVDWEIREYSDLDYQLTRKANERTRLEEDIHMLEESLREYERENYIAERIDTNYRLIFNFLKRKKVKQNVFEDIFSKKLDETTICEELDRLGLDKDYHIHVKELVNDLKKVKNFQQFQAQYGCVSAQIKRLFELQRHEIKRIVERIKDIENEILEIERKKLIAPEQLKKLNEEKETILSIYEKKINNSIFVTNGKTILLNFLDHYSSGLIKILNCVKEKASNINTIIERLNKRVEEDGFDVFISSKSQDYKDAFKVYKYLHDNGHKPFLADPVLREIGTDYYGYLIRRIVNKCNFMIVYASNVDYMNTSYVHQEWNQFLDELSSGLKEGKLFSIISPSITAKMLPPGLNVRQFFTTDKYEESLLQYLKLDKQNQL